MIIDALNTAAVSIIETGHHARHLVCLVRSFANRWRKTSTHKILAHNVTIYSYLLQTGA